jgi:hypothetical protein
VRGEGEDGVRGEGGSQRCGCDGEKRHSFI